LILGAALAFALVAPAAAHNVDNNDASSFVDGRNLFRVDYANDFFTGSDRYYTEGVGFNLFDAVLEKSPVMRALFSLPGGSRSYGLLLRQSTFTPSRVGERAAIVNDRPWASYVFLGHELVSKDPASGLALTTELDAGVIGPAGGGEAQVKIHARLHMDVPRGWDNQIRNNPVVDYYARLEKTVGAWRWGDAGVYGDATAGTLYDNAAAGAQARLGRVDENSKKRFFAFARGEEKAVGYDATLQGGLFNRPQTYYTTPDSQINRFVYRWDVGVALDFGSFVLEATRSAVGREFAGGIPHQWGEFSVTKRF
jgi:hypothetical protein